MGEHVPNVHQYFLIFIILAVQQLYHFVEMTIVVALVGASTALISIALFIALFVTLGHLVAILGSRKFETK